MIIDIAFQTERKSNVEAMMFRLRDETKYHEENNLKMITTEELLSKNDSLRRKDLKERTEDLQYGKKLEKDEAKRDTIQVKERLKSKLKAK